LGALRNGLKTEYLIAKNRFESLEKILSTVRTTSIEAQGTKFRPFRQALDELETEKFIYNQLKAKHRQEIITLEVPRNPVEIVDVAEPNLRPVSPNVFLNVLLSIFVGLAAGVGLAYFIEYLDTSIKKITINTKNLDNYLEKSIFEPNEREKSDIVGVVNGLAWTSVGGDVLKIEAVKIRGKGNMQITGSLGEVMKESSRIAFSVIKVLIDE